MSQTSRSSRDDSLIDGQYRLQYLLGEGGMGTVWAAQDIHLQRPVALKLLSKQLCQRELAQARFEREAQLIARIHCPHVVQIFAQGRTEHDVPYLVMELLRGEDLATRLEREGACSLSEAAPIVAQLCRGLQRAHQEGLVHRDIKPHNIFLAREDDGSATEPVVKLLDFGIAKDLSAAPGSLTLHGEVMGSVLYISPEQLRDPQTVDASADVWALGIVIYELLTGRVPFDVHSLAELFEHHRHGRFTPASSLVPELPAELDELLSRAIHIDSQQRFQRVSELGEAFALIARRHARGWSVPRQKQALRSDSPSPHETMDSSELAGAQLTPRRWRLSAALTGAVSIAVMLAWQLAFAQHTHAPTLASRATSREAQAIERVTAAPKTPDLIAPDERAELAPPDVMPAKASSSTRIRKQRSNLQKPQIPAQPPLTAPAASDTPLEAATKPPSHERRNHGF